MGERRRPRHGKEPAGEARSAHAEDTAHEGPVPGAADGTEEPQVPLRPLGTGRAERRRAAKRIRRRRRLRTTREIPILLGVALLIALVLKTFLVQAFVIPSGSMEETIRIDDRVLVDKLTPWFGWQPERGDVVVFQDPGGWLSHDKPSGSSAPMGIRQLRDGLTWIGLLPSQDSQDLIKRVIGVGGDTVVCCDAQGRVSVNGTPLDEPYLHPTSAPSEIEFEVKVPQDRIFVMGDHRSSSADSRYHLKDPGEGTVPEDLVVGRAMVIAWPFAHWQHLGGSEAFAAVPDSGQEPVEASASPGRASPGGAGTVTGENQTAQLPIPAELPLVMGVMGLLRPSRGLECSVRSGCGGCGSRRTVRSGGAGGPSDEAGRRGGRRGALSWRRRTGRGRGPG